MYRPASLLLIRAPLRERSNAHPLGTWVLNSSIDARCWFPLVHAPSFPFLGILVSPAANGSHALFHPRSSLYSSGWYLRGVDAILLSTVRSAGPNQLLFQQFYLFFSLPSLHRPLHPRTSLRVLLRSSGRQRGPSGLHNTQSTCLRFFRIAKCDFRPKRALLSSRPLVMPSKRSLHTSRVRSSTPRPDTPS